MNLRRFQQVIIATAAAALLLPPNATAAKAPRQAAPPAPHQTPSAGPVEIRIPKSVYQPPASTREGRNPFFPESGPTESNPAPSSAPELFALVLNGITGPPKRTAMINGRTFEEGETADVKITDGRRVAVQCVQIKDDSAVILVAGQRRELRLRAGV